MAITMTATATATRPRRVTDSGSSSNSSADDSGSSARGGSMFRRMSAQAMGLEANALCHRSHWVPKSARSTCFTCRRPFRLWTKKHHCRFCGEVVCRNCSTQRILIERKTLRSCDACVSVNVQTISELSRRNSLNDLDARDSGVAMRGGSFIGGGGGRRSDGALLRKSMSLPPSHQARTKRSRSSVSKREASTGMATLQSLRRRYRTQLPYVVVVFLLTLAGLTNMLVRRA